MTVTREASTFVTLRNLLREPASTPYSGFIGTFMARDALSLAATYLGLSRDDTVLLPAYLCKEVLRPFADRCRVIFYDLEDDLSADPARIAPRLARERIRLLVVINYFGFLQPHRRELAALCAAHRTTLLEDCAHSLLTRGSGETGDLSVVSYRKLLPVFDGGGLMVKSGAHDFAVPYRPRLYSNVLSVLATAKALSGVQSDALSRAGVADRRAPNAAGERPRAPSKVLPLSWFTANGAANAPAAEIVERRRRDYRFWEGLVAQSSELKPVMPELGDGVCPLGFAVVARDRDAWKQRLQAAGLQMRVHWTLPPAVARDCGNSWDLSNRMLTLPIYPELNDSLQTRAMGVLAESAR